MTKREARKQIVGYLITRLRNQDTCDDLKETSKPSDYERLCEAELEIAAELADRYGVEA